MLLQYHMHVKHNVMPGAGSLPWSWHVAQHLYVNADPDAH